MSSRVEFVSKYYRDDTVYSFNFTLAKKDKNIYKVIDLIVAPNEAKAKDKSLRAPPPVSTFYGKYVTIVDGYLVPLNK